MNINLAKGGESMPIHEIRKRKIVAVIRGATIHTIVPIAQALRLGGVTALEITMETPNAPRMIERLREEFQSDVLIGAGTVLDAETARAAILSGAQFIFSPTVNKETIRMAKRYGVISVPGAMTPTEILQAYEAGADLIKVFPAHILGPEYFKAVAGPLPHIPLMPTGGIHLGNAKEYIEAGAVAIGLGSTLVAAKQKIDSESLPQLTERARCFVEQVDVAKQIVQR